MDMVIATNSKPLPNGHTAAAPYTALQDLNHLVDQRQTFLQPTSAHQRAAIAATKALIDPLAQSIAQIQQQRQIENRRKRKRGSDEAEDPVLQLKQIYIDGLGVKQVWEQARRILDVALVELERDVELLSSAVDELEEAHGGMKEVALEDAVNGESTNDDEFDDDEKGVRIDDDESQAEVEDEDALEEGDERIEDDSGIMHSDQAASVNDEEDEEPRATFIQDPNKLNDGFFSIDDFNKQSQFLEQMDARGDDDNPSDEDEIDWDADPMAQPLSAASRQAKSKRKSQTVDQDETDDGSEDGPTFGNANLNASDSAEDEDEDQNMDDVGGDDLDGMMPGLTNTNDVLYADFFEPPPQRPSKNKRMRALPKTQPPKTAEAAQIPEQTAEQEAADLERAMADVRRDLLDSEDEEDNLEDDAEDDDVSDAGSDVLPRLPASKRNDKGLSTHEKQQLRIREEIRRLEAINVSKKPWTLSGEASAQARPINSLIEEDLEFERTGKPVPVITAEVSTDLEALIKRRILARDFDELVRRLPTTLDGAGDTRRGRADTVVDDTKATTGLGELYEQEYQKNADPASYTDKRSAAIKKQHEEIDKLWKEVRDQLDVLGNLHFKPKRAEIEVKTVEDKPRIAMEDARPTAGDVEGSMLAPQEIYKPGADSKGTGKDEVLRKGGASVNREEMSREEKTRRRRREKERSKKAQDNRKVKTLGADGKPKALGKREQKEGIVQDLAKAGVKVIGKGGKLEQIGDKKARQGEDRATVVGSGALKL